MFVRKNQGERRVSPRLYKLLLTAHIAVSVGWLGVVFAKLVLALVAATTGAPDVSAALLVSLNVVNIAFAPVAIATIVTGVLLSLGTKWGVLQHYWVVTKLVLTVGVIGTAVQVAPRLVGQATAAPSGLAGDEATLLGLPWAPAVVLSFAVAHLLMLGAATVVSVYKPWGKTWLGRRKDARPRVDQAATPGTGDATPARLDRRASVERAA
jgi:hypothetical protein